MSFPPCYSESLLQLCIEISISSNSRNLLQFLQCVAVHCKGERRKNHTPIPMVKEIHTETSSLRTLVYAQKPQRNCSIMNSALGPYPTKNAQKQTCRYFVGTVPTLRRKEPAENMYSSTDFSKGGLSEKKPSWCFGWGRKVNWRK